MRSNKQFATAGAAGSVVLIAALTAMIISGGDSGTKPVDDGPGSSAREDQPYASNSPSPKSESFDAIGVTLREAPAGTLTKVSRAEALGAVAEDGIRMDIQESITPNATLKQYEKRELVPSDPSQPPAPIEMYIWDVVFPDAPQDIRQPTGIETPVVGAPCDFHVIVNAETAVVIEAFQLPCKVLGS